MNIVSKILDDLDGFKQEANYIFNGSKLLKRGGGENLDPFLFLQILIPHIQNLVHPYGYLLEVRFPVVLKKFLFRQVATPIRVLLYFTH